MTENIENEIEEKLQELIELRVNEALMEEKVRLASLMIEENETIAKIIKYTEFNEEEIEYIKTENA